MFWISIGTFWVGIITAIVFYTCKALGFALSYIFSDAFQRYIADPIISLVSPEAFKQASILLLFVSILALSYRGANDLYLHYYRRNRTKPREPV